jgi:hypothetical protein
LPNGSISNNLLRVPKAAMMVVIDEHDQSRCQHTVKLELHRGADERRAPAHHPPTPNRGLLRQRRSSTPRFLGRPVSAGIAAKLWRSVLARPSCRRADRGTRRSSAGDSDWQTGIGMPGVPAGLLGAGRADRVHVEHRSVSVPVEMAPAFGCFHHHWPWGACVRACPAHAYVPAHRHRVRHEYVYFGPYVRPVETVATGHHVPRFRTVWFGPRRSAVRHRPVCAV